MSQKSFKLTTTTTTTRSPTTGSSPWPGCSLQEQSWPHQVKSFRFFLRGFRITHGRPYYSPNLLFYSVHSADFDQWKIVSKLLNVLLPSHGPLLPLPPPAFYFLLLDFHFLEYKFFYSISVPEKFCEMRRLTGLYHPKIQTYSERSQERTYSNYLAGRIFLGNQTLNWYYLRAAFGYYSNFDAKLFLRHWKYSSFNFN